MLIGVKHEVEIVLEYTWRVPPYHGRLDASEHVWNVDKHAFEDSVLYFGN